MNRVRISCVAGLGAWALAIVSATSALAQQPQPAASKVLGDWILAKSAGEVRTDIDDAIDDLVADMIFFKRPIARSRLGDVTLFCRRFQFSVVQGKTFVSRCDGRRADKSPVGGGKVKVKFKGDTMALTQRLSASKVVQAWKGDDGGRRQVSTVSSDGKTLTMRVAISSDQLPRPLRYTIVYKRK